MKDIPDRNQWSLKPEGCFCYPIVIVYGGSDKLTIILSYREDDYGNTLLTVFKCNASWKIPD